MNTPRHFLILIAATIVGCGSIGPQTDPGPVDPSPTLQYEQLDILREQVRHTFEAMYHRAHGYGAPVVAETVAGERALKLVKAAPNTPDWAVELVQQPDAVVVFLDLLDRPDIPTGVLFVPIPSSGFQHPDMPGGPGIVLMYGIEHRGEFNPRLEAATPATLSSPPLLPVLTPSTFRQKLKQKATFTFLLSSNGCGASQSFYPMLATLIGEYEILNVFDVPYSAFRDTPEKSLLKEAVQVVAFPTLVHVENGAVHSRRVGGGRDVAAYWRTAQFFADAGLIELSVDWVLDMRGAPVDDTAWHRSLAINAADLTLVNFEGTDLAGAPLKDANLRFSTLRHADLRNADLRGADLTGADLTSADITGARLDGAIFGETTCPDGRVSSETCTP